MKTKNIVGKIFDSNNYGKFIVLEKTNKVISKSSLYKIKFLETETIKLTRSVYILNGKIRDEYAKTVLKKACLGKAKASNFFYNTWLCMIQRCYNEKFKDTAFQEITGRENRKNCKVFFWLR